MIVDRPIYTQTDVDRIRELDGVEYVTPDGSLSSVQLRRGNESVTGGFAVQATEARTFETDLIDIVQGERFDGEDEAVVNEVLAEMLVPSVEVGDEIAITYEDGRTTNLTVVGIVDDEILGFLFPAVFVPLDPHYTITVETPRGSEERAYTSLQIGVQDVESLEHVRDEVAEYFASEADATELKHDEDDIRVQSLEDIVEQIGEVIDELTFFIGGIAAISLLVGSIGIANIMIVSVTERTREIGIMKAIGARKRDVIQLFLVEALILGSIGAIFGVLLGLGFGYLAVRLAGWPMVYPLEWILIAVVMGILVGVVSGLYPAWRAARVDPIEALRRE